jgi:hypothetical protein
MLPSAPAAGPSDPALVCRIGKIGDRRAIHPEPIDGHAVNRRFLGVMPIGSHAKRAARYPHHAIPKTAGVIDQRCIKHAHNDSGPWIIGGSLGSRWTRDRWPATSRRPSLQKCRKPGEKSSRSFCRLRGDFPERSGMIRAFPARIRDFRMSRFGPGFPLW